MAPNAVARPSAPDGRLDTLVHRNPPFTAFETGGRGEDEAEQAVADLIASMPPQFWIFHERYDRAYYEYTVIHLGNEVVSRYLVDMTFVYLAMDWCHVAPNPGHYAWSLLKGRVAAELAEQGRTPAARETLAFARAIQTASAPFLASFRESFREAYGQPAAELEDGLEVWEHMSRLSERHFDVLVLHAVLGFDTKDTALIMGVSRATVRSTRRTAKVRLAAAMGCRFEIDPDD
ncbi:sigma factor-like helix-turn-helix DNA-binding protein [Streptomyces sp. NPDC002884]|uniref:sigma factor-like helix-turn-helix DNA-binding protein n=1 Tax=Streptomyces sp. NPDC002884 TaxID=3154544 RepID=UPI00332F2190